jgi:hypothetical protein
VSRYTHPSTPLIRRTWEDHGSNKIGVSS